MWSTLRHRASPDVVDMSDGDIERRGCLAGVDMLGSLGGGSSPPSAREDFRGSTTRVGQQNTPLEPGFGVSVRGGDDGYEGAHGVGGGCDVLPKKVE